MRRSDPIKSGMAHPITPKLASRRGFVLGASAIGMLTAATPMSALGARRSASSRHAADIARSLHATQPTPALSLAVARTDRLLWAEALGKADLESDIDATIAHRFKMGSVSKALTATAAARLVSRGILDLETPISRWLPDLPEKHRQTTMKLLLTHRGGIRHYVRRDGDETAPGGPIDLRAYRTNQDILSLFINDPLVAPPGEKVFYSTFGFTLASLVMEAASGQPFPELLKAQIGMHFGLSSLDDDSPFAIRPKRVRGYRNPKSSREFDPRQPEGWTNAVQTNPAYKWAGGGLIMTPSDLARFGAALIDSPHSKVTAAERLLLFTALTPAQPDMPPLGLAWRIDVDSRGRQRWHHAGTQEGGRASLVIYPDQGLSIAFATNVASTPANVLEPSSSLADVFA